MTSTSSSSPPPVSSLPAPERFPLLVFDWDGTLMDSIGTIVACMQEVVTELELPALEDQTIRDTIGLGMAETLDALYPEGDDALRGRIIERYRHHWFAGFRSRQVMFEGVADLLEQLAGRGHLLAVATGKSRRGLDHDLERSGLGRFFQATRTVDESPGKPSPAMLLEILDELGSRPEEALMVGDTTHDLRMARAARVGAVGVLSGSHGEHHLSPLEPLALLPSVHRLPGWLIGSGGGED